MIAVALALSLLNTLGLSDPYDWRHGLHASVRFGRVDQIRFMLAAFPELLDETERSTKRPLTPLQIAADRNHVAVMTLLIELGADLNKGEGHLGTPLQLATRNGHREAAELLLAHGAVLDIFSAVALDRRAEVERYLRFAEVLGMAHWLANARLRMNWESTPLMQIAATRGHTEMAKLLLRYGADPAARVIEIPCFVSDINRKGTVIGLTPAGTRTPDLYVPVRKP